MTPRQSNQNTAISKQIGDAIQAFYKTARYLELEKEFWGNPAAICSKVIPVWDLSPEANRFNWEVQIGYQNCALKSYFENELRFKLDRPQVFSNTHVFGELDKSPFLFVIDHWLRRVSLTPPFLEEGQNGLLRKRDGFHRLAVALLSGCNTIPCWVQTC